MNLKKLFVVNNFFGNKKTEAQKDINVLEHSFSVLDSSFENLISNYVSFILTESENDIGTDKKSMSDSYESFLEDLKQTSKLLVGFCNKYKTPNGLKDLGLSVSIENKAKHTKESYDLLLTKLNKSTNPNSEELLKCLNKAVFSYNFIYYVSSKNF
jgi:hypothetical protein